MSHLTTTDRLVDPDAPAAGRTRLYSLGGDFWLVRDDGTIRRVSGELTEASGPTELSFGAIADGQLLQRVGSLIQGFSFSGGDVIEVVVPSDLGTPVGGVYTLQTGKVYLFRTMVDLGTDRLVAVGPCSLVGYSRLENGVSTTSASPLLTCSGEIEIYNLQLSNPSGPCFAYTDAPFSRITLESSLFVNGAADTITGTTGTLVVLLRGNRWQGGVSGLRLQGAIAGIQIQSGFIGLTDPAARYLELAAGLLTGAASIQDCLFSTASGQTALYVDPGIVPSVGAGVTRTGFFGAGTPIGGISQATVGWIFKFNPGIRDSTWAGNISFGGNATLTTVPDAVTWVEISTGVNWMTAPTSERMSLFGGPATGGRLQMDGRLPVAFGGVFAILIESVSPNQNLEVRLRRYVALTATPETVGFVVPVAYKATAIAVTVPFLVRLETGDQLWLEVRNTSGISSLLISRAAIQAAATG